MYKGVKAFLYKDSTVVVDKRDVKNAKDEDFKEVSLFLPYKFIKECAEEIEFLGLDDDFEE